MQRDHWASHRKLFSKDKKNGVEKKHTNRERVKESERERKRDTHKIFSRDSHNILSTAQLFIKVPFKIRTALIKITISEKNTVATEYTFIHISL